MNKPIHIISDLHLSQSRADLFALFKQYMQKIAPKSRSLYVLGDLFEVWLGDDCLAQADPMSQLYFDVIELFNNYSATVGELFFIHGNRDFLLAGEFEKKTGGKLLTEPFIFELAQQKIALMHGDSLCTEDIAYQEFRSMVRNPQWQSEFLSLPIAKRVEIAMGMREKSKTAQTEKSAEIMDVNPVSVKCFFQKYSVDYLIHGHTHRQARHQITIDKKQLQRIVLSDWGKQGFYLALTKDDTLRLEIQECYFCSSQD